MFKLKKIFEIQAARKPALVSLRNEMYKENKVNEDSVLRITRCLFGKCDSDDTLRMLEEQIEADKMRFKERFGIDVDQLEKEDEENVNPNIIRKNCELKLKKFNRNRKRKIEYLQHKKLTGQFLNIFLFYLAPYIKNLNIFHKYYYQTNFDKFTDKQPAFYEFLVYLPLSVFEKMNVNFT